MIPFLQYVVRSVTGMVNVVFIVIISEQFSYKPDVDKAFVRLGPSFEEAHSVLLEFVRYNAVKLLIIEHSVYLIRIPIHSCICVIFRPLFGVSATFLVITIITRTVALTPTNRIEIKLSIFLTVYVVDHLR